MVKRKGTNTSETLHGTGEADSLVGLGGSDRIKAREGADVVSGGDGGDRILGGDGNDVIYGHSAADQRPSSGFIRAEQIADIGYGAVQTALAPGDDGFLYALSKDSGEINRIDTDTGDRTTFLDIADGQIGEGGERGVLGMAFHPDYASNGRFFVYMTNAAGDIEVREYERGGGSPPTATLTQTVITIPHPTYNNHNGGSIAFGPDGYLYIGTGDGGSGGDPDHNAQNTDSLLGKILRIDVDSDGFPGDDDKNYAIPDDNPFVGVSGADEIWALGVRNPWRFSFDPDTGDLYIGDVGQDSKEEIDFVPAGTPGGLNFGWNYREGNQHYDGTPPDGLTFTDPVFVYSHKSASASVTGGVINHGPGKGLDGAYMFSDFITGKFYTLRMVDGTMEDEAERSAQLRGDELGQVVAYGVDGDGNVLAVSLNGGIYRLHFGVASGDGSDAIHGGDGDDQLWGGVGRDRLWGDAGRDRLDGGIGNDWLKGGSNADIFSFLSGMGKDVVKDFDAVGDNHDRLDLGGLKAITGYENLRAHHMTADGHDVVISAGSDRITLENVKLSDLDRGDFYF